MTLLPPVPVAVLLAAAGASVLVDEGRAARRRLARTGGGRPGRRPPRTSPVPGPVVLDLVAAVLEAGAPVTTALRVVGECLAAHGAAEGAQLLGLAQRHELALAGAPVAGTGWPALLDATLVLARDAGLAPAPLLVAAAGDERGRRAARQRQAAARLGVRVVLPTGLCLLPAFVLLTVVPLVLALLGGAP